MNCLALRPFARPAAGVGVRTREPHRYQVAMDSEVFPPGKTYAAYISSMRTLGRVPGEATEALTVGGDGVSTFAGPGPGGRFVCGK